MRTPTIQCALTLALIIVLAYGIFAPQSGVLALSPAGGAGGTPSPVGTPAPRGTPQPARPAPPTPTANTGGTPAARPTLAVPIGSPSPVAAGIPGTPVGSATPTAGRASVFVRRDLSPLSFSLTGRTQVVQTTMDVEVLASGSFTRQPGWRLTLAVDQFRAIGIPSRTLPGDAVTLVGVAVRCVQQTGCSDPRNGIAYPLTMPAGEAVAIYGAAPGSGSGQFVITLTFAVEVPANASAGSYGTTIAVGIANGR